jgi:hypothetical protein
MRNAIANCICLTSISCLNTKANVAVLFAYHDFMTIFTYYMPSSCAHFFCAAFFTFQLFACIVFNRDDNADTKSDSAY